MKKKRNGIKSPLLFSLLFVLFISVSPFIMADQVLWNTQINLDELTPISEQKIINYIQTLRLYLTTFEQQISTQENSEIESDELSQLFTDQMNDLQSLKTQLTTLRTLSREWREDNIELTRLLQECEQIIATLERRLASATQGVEDALENWWHMETLLSESDQVIINWENDYNRIQQQYAKARRGAIISFTIGGVSFGAGIPLIIEGVRKDNQAMLWSGVGTIAVGGVVWVLGHYLFQWW